MKTSPHRILQTVPTLILAAGHGGADPGACFGPFKESLEAVALTDAIAALLRPALPAGSLIVAPHHQDTHETIPWINARYKMGAAWAIEIHRDSADTIKEPAASLRGGVYHGASGASMDIAENMASAMRRAGAHESTWTRDHRDSRFRSLGWISQVACLSHLLELGFMEGRHDAEHLEHLAGIAAAALANAFAGITLTKPNK